MPVNMEIVNEGKTMNMVDSGVLEKDETLDAFRRAVVMLDAAPHAIDIICNVLELEAMPMNPLVYLTSPDVKKFLSHEKMGAIGLIAKEGTAGERFATLLLSLFAKFLLNRSVHYFANPEAAQEFFDKQREVAAQREAQRLQQK